MNDDEVNTSNEDALIVEQRLTLMLKRLRMLLVIFIAQIVLAQVADLTREDLQSGSDIATLVAFSMIALFVVLIISLVVFTFKTSSMFNGVELTIVLSVIASLSMINFLAIIVLFIQSYHEFGVRGYKMNILNAAVSSKDKK